MSLVLKTTNNNKITRPNLVPGFSSLLGKIETVRCCNKPDSVGPRLRVVPHFSSGIVGRAKRVKKATRVSPFLAWDDFHSRSRRARVLLALLSLRKNGGLLVVYVGPNRSLVLTTAVHSIDWMICKEKLYTSYPVFSLDTAFDPPLATVMARSPCLSCNGCL